ncbi:PLP-dependent cysteine synthase family protein [Pendulispora albinea]
MAKLEADFNRSSDTHLLKVDLPHFHGVQLYLKDESTHITGSLKHRLARSLFLYGIANGWIKEGTTVVEASSGSTAISEAYFARLLELPFVAVMPRSTSPEKVALIESYGARCHFVEAASQMHDAAVQLARASGGHFMDQFTFAERATDWRGNNNIAESIFSQLAREPHPVPRFIVCGAGTGGTSATIGRYIRYRSFHTELCVVDPEHSAYFDYYKTDDPEVFVAQGSGVEGIGRPRTEPSFLPKIVDRMLKIPDAASYATVHFLRGILHRALGASTGTNVWGALELMAEMHAAGETGSIVTLICDGGERYLQTYFDEGWLARNKIDLGPYRQRLQRFYDAGEWQPLAEQASRNAP